MDLMVVRRVARISLGPRMSVVSEVFIWLSFVLIQLLPSEEQSRLESTHTQKSDH